MICFVFKMLQPGIVKHWFVSYQLNEISTLLQIQSTRVYVTFQLAESTYTSL